MERSEITDIVRDTFQKEIAPVFERMFEFLSGAIERNASLSERQFEAYKEREEDLKELIKANLQLTALVDNIRVDANRQMESYRAELHSAKDMYNRREVELREQYTRASEAYIRLAEKPSSQGTVNIKSSNL